MSSPQRGIRILPAAEGLSEAVDRLRAGKLVAFPTETVYGLGALAIDPEAVARIFAAKGRPSTNPLIVHVANPSAAVPFVSRWTPAADKLAAHFWPGPLTLVLEKSSAVPDIVTASGTTVALRMPAHPVALELLERLGPDAPIAAPSANRSEEISPTIAEHVVASLGPHVDDLLILDGGPTSVGIESTVVDVTGPHPRILRPGMVTFEMLQAIVGEVITGVHPVDNTLRSPGQMPRHYAPRTPLVIVAPANLTAAVKDADEGVLLLTHGLLSGARVITMPQTPAGYAARLYAALREMDDSGVRRIVVEEPPTTPDWAAIQDRLRRAAVPKGH